MTTFCIVFYESSLSTIGPFTSDHCIDPRTNDPVNNAQIAPARINWNLQGTSLVQCYIVMVCVLSCKKTDCFWKQDINLPELSRNPPFSLRLALLKNDIYLIYFFITVFHKFKELCNIYLHVQYVYCTNIDKPRVLSWKYWRAGHRDTPGHNTTFYYYLYKKY